MLKFYARFEINDETGDSLTDHDMTEIHYSRITSLQVRYLQSGVKKFNGTFCNHVFMLYSMRGLSRVT